MWLSFPALFCSLRVTSMVVGYCSAAEGLALGLSHSCSSTPLWCELFFGQPDPTQPAQHLYLEQPGVVSSESGPHPAEDKLPNLAD
jgi:hypothetical protein